MRARAVWRAVSVLLMFLCTAGLLVGGEAQDAPKKAGNEVTNPYTSPTDVRQGDVSLRSWCATCHGRDARGGRGPDLTNGQFRHGSSDEAVFNNIKNGIPGTDMVSLADLDDKFLWQIVAAIRARAEPPKPPPGDIEAGRRLFAKHNCRTCHWDGQEGGRRGVNLTASTASVQYAKESIVDPDANFRENPGPEQHWNQQVVVITASGKTSVGRWLNETGAHLLFMDDQDEIHTLAKEDIVALSKPRHSLMPSFKDAVNEQDLDDLVAYLFSIRRNPQPKESQ